MEIYVGALYFIFLVIYYRSIHKVYRHLIDKYKPSKQDDLVINLGIKRIYFINNEIVLKQVLKSHGDDQEIDHNNYIGCRENSSPFSFSKHLGDFSDTFRANRYLLFSSRKMSFNKLLKRYVMRSWAQFFYGKEVDMKKYAELRKFYKRYLKSFESSLVAKIPLVGMFWKYLLNKLYQDDLIHLRIAMSVLGYNLQEGKPISNDPQLALNMLRMYDYIYSIMFLALTSPKEPLSQIISDGYIHPLRCLKNGEPIGKIPAGSVIYYDLPRTGLYFSDGPKACPGQVLFEKCLIPLIEEMRSWIVIDNSEYLECDIYRNKCQCDFIRTNPGDPVPKFERIDNYQVRLPWNFLAEVIDDNDDTYGAVVGLERNTLLFKYVVNRATTILRAVSNLQGIITSVDSGDAYFLAGAIGYKLNLPIYYTDELAIESPARLAYFNTVIDSEMLSHLIDLQSRNKYKLVKILTLVKNDNLPDADVYVYEAIYELPVSGVNSTKSKTSVTKEEQSDEELD